MAVQVFAENYCLNRFKKTFIIGLWWSITSLHQVNTGSRYKWCITSLLLNNKIIINQHPLLKPFTSETERRSTTSLHRVTSHPSVKTGSRYNWFITSLLLNSTMIINEHAPLKQFTSETEWWSTTSHHSNELHLHRIKNGKNAANWQRKCMWKIIV